MRLKTLDSAQDFELVAGWLAEKENYQWLDFGGGRRLVTPALLKVMIQRGKDVLRIFTADDGDVPIGVVGLNNVDREFRTATAWCVLGDKAYARRGYTTRALSKLLTLGFRELGLHAINSWALENNPKNSIRVAEAVGFRFVGRQRECHWVNGRPYDRLLIDVLESEFKEL
jgi:RimJ/RimL family protein N-acetyltransferase